MGALRQCVSGMLVALGTSNTSVQLIMVSLQLSELLLISLLHLHNGDLELLESISIYHGCWRRIEVFIQGLASEAKLSANHGWERKR